MIQIYNPVFPACAGVIPGYDPLAIGISRIPRVCGGDPGRRLSASSSKRYSPRVRG